MNTIERAFIRAVLIAGVALAMLGFGANPVSAKGAEFIDLAPVTFPDIDPCTGDLVHVTLDSEVQIVETGNGSTVIFRSSTVSSDGATGRGIETRHFVGHRYDFNLRFMVSHPDGHRYSITAALNGEGTPVFGPPTLRCIVPAT